MKKMTNPIGGKMFNDVLTILVLMKLPYGHGLNSSTDGDVKSVKDETTLYEPGDDFDEGYANCTNDYCLPDEEYLDLIAAHISPHLLGYVLIAMHSVVFTIGLLGNFLVCLAIYRNHTMRTVTNYFIVNLAVADFLVILFCLPSTVLWDITDTWFLGLELCKIILYFQTVSVAVSVMTLTFISIDRWYAICFPLRFKSTTSRAKKAIVVIWLCALLYDIPELVVLQIFPSDQIRVKTIYYTQCAQSWGTESKQLFTCITLVCLYFGPLIFMTVAYYQIVRVLWRGDIPGHNLSARICRGNEIPSAGIGNPEGQLKSRRKAAKMLVAVVIMFAICYLPVHLLSILRQMMDLPSGELTRAFSLLAHWLCYANSAVNPVIYNFMSVGAGVFILRTIFMHPELTNVTLQPVFNELCLIIVIAAASAVVFLFIFVPNFSGIVKSSKRDENPVLSSVEYEFLTEGKFRKEFNRTFCCTDNGASNHRGVYRFVGTSNMASRRSQMLTRSINTTTNNNVRHSFEVIPLGAITPVDQADKRK